VTEHLGVVARGASACRAALAEARERAATNATPRVWDPLPALTPRPDQAAVDKARTTPVGMPAYVEPDDPDIPTPDDAPPEEDWR